MTDIRWDNAPTGTLTTSSADPGSTPPSLVSVSGASQALVQNTGTRPNRIWLSPFVSQQCSVNWDLSGDWSNYALRLMYSFNQTPAHNNTSVFAVRNSADTDWAWFLRIDTSRRLRLWTGPIGSPTLLSNPATVFSIETEYRLEARYDGSNLSFRAFLGDDDATPLVDQTHAVAAHNPPSIRLGVYSNLANGHPVMRFDDILFRDDDSDWLGPNVTVSDLQLRRNAAIIL